MTSMCNINRLAFSRVQNFSRDSFNLFRLKKIRFKSEVFDNRGSVSWVNSFLDQFGGGGAFETNVD